LSDCKQKEKIRNVAHIGAHISTVLKMQTFTLHGNMFW